MEPLNDNITLHTPWLPMIETPWGIERHARNVYTHTIFGTFQEEVVSARDKCDIQSIWFRLMMNGSQEFSGKIREVHYNTCTKMSQCSCKLFESTGILCRHIILVLKGAGCTEIPEQYLLCRWTKTATREVVFDANGHALPGSSTSPPPNMRKL